MTLPTLGGESRLTTFMVWIKRIGFALLWIVGGSAALALGMHLHIDTELGHRGIVGGFNHGMASLLDGRMSIEEVDYASLTTVHVRGLQAFDPQDERVMEVARARATVPWWTTIFQGKLMMEDLQAYDGRIWIRRGEYSSTSIGEAFSTSGGEQDTSGGSKLDIDTGWAFVRNMRLIIAINNRLVFGNIRASMRVTRTGDSPAEIDLRHVYTVLAHPRPMGAAIRLMNARADIRPQTANIVEMTTGACLNSSPMGMHLVYRDRVAHLEIDKEDGLGGLASLGLRIFQHFNSHLDVTDRELHVPMPNCPGSDDDDEDTDEAQKERAEEDAAADEDTDEARDERTDERAEVDEDNDEEREERVDERE